MRAWIFHFILVLILRTLLIKRCFVKCITPSTPLICKSSKGSNLNELVDCLSGTGDESRDQIENHLPNKKLDQTSQEDLQILHQSSCDIHKFIQLFHQPYILLTQPDVSPIWCPAAKGYQIHEIRNTKIGEIGKHLQYLKSTGIRIFVCLLPMVTTLNVIHAAHIVEVSSDDYLWILPENEISKFDVEFEPINVFYLQTKNESFCPMSKSYELQTQSVLTIKQKSKDHPTRSTLQTIGKFSENKIEKSDELIRYTTNFRPQFFIKYPQIRIVTAIDPPFVSSIPLYNEKCHGRKCMKYVKNLQTGDRKVETFCCVGLCIDMMAYLETDMKAQFEIWLVEDGFYGAKINGTWNGMVSDVIQNKADVIIAPFLMTRDRLLALDFTDESYLNGGMALVTVAQKSNMTLFNFRTFQPLSASMWFVLLSLTLAASLIVYFAEKLSISTPMYPLWESVNYFTGLAFARDIGALNPVKLGSRVIGISVALFMLIVMSTYTAVLTSNMVASTVSLPIHGLKDEKIINPTPSFKFGTQLNTGYVEYFDPKRDPSFQKTFLFMKRYNYADTSQAIRDLKSGKLNAVINDYYILRYYMVRQPDCSIRMVGKVVPDAGYSLAMRKGSTYRNILSELVRKYKYDGTIERLQMKWFSNNCHDQNRGHQAAERAGITSFGGLLIIASFVCFLLIPCLFCFEVVRKRFSSEDKEVSNMGLGEKAMLILPGSVRRR